MTNVLIFVSGLGIFVTTTVATLVFGYVRMDALYAQDRKESPMPSQVSEQDASVSTVEKAPEEAPEQDPSVQAAGDAEARRTA